MGQDNLKTHDGLPTVKNDKGEDMSEYSITVTDPRLNGGKPTNIPSLWGGQIVSEDEAVENALNTKNEYRSFESIKEAVDDAIRKSEAGGANAPKKYAKGGNVEQMNKLFADGGMMDDSGEQVNGVEVPPGSLREEVADDIPAQLSEGEFVVPADVVRYIGLEKLMAMRDKAKQGLERMEEMGQMGNADEVANPDQTFNEQGDEDFAAEIDDIMAEEGEGYALGGDVTAGNVGRMKFANNPGVDVRYYRHEDGRVMFITYINGKPSTAIPEGFKQSDKPVEELVGREAEDRESTTTPTAPSPTSGGESSGDGGPTPTPTAPMSEEDQAVQDAKFQTTTKATALVRQIEKNPLLTILPLVPLATKFATMSIKQAEKANKEAIQGRVTAPGAFGGWSQSAIDAGAKAAATEAGRQPGDGAGIPGGDTGAVTSGSIAAAAATAMSDTDGRNAMDAMMDVIAAHEGTPGTKGPAPAAPAPAPAPAAAPGSGNQAGALGGGPDGGSSVGVTHICTASYNVALITPTHFKSLKHYGVGLRKRDPYLMRAYDAFGPKLASYVGKSGVADKAAKFLTAYYTAVQTKDSLSATQKVFSYASDYILRPAYRIIGWVLIKFVDKK